MEIQFYMLSFSDDVLPCKQYLMALILKCSTELLFVWAELLHEEQDIFAYTHAIQEKVLRKKEKKRR